MNNGNLGIFEVGSNILTSDLSLLIVAPAGAKCVPQAAFGILRVGFSIGRIRDWEQGRSAVDAPSRLLLTIIEKEPEAIERALSAA